MEEALSDGDEAGVGVAIVTVSTNRRLTVTAGDILKPARLSLRVS